MRLRLGVAGGPVPRVPGDVDKGTNARHRILGVRPDGADALLAGPVSIGTSCGTRVLVHRAEECHVV